MATFEKLHAKLWVLQDMLPGSQMPRTMVVYRTNSGDLVLHSVIELDEANRAELERFGRPKWMIVPSGLHRLDAPKYKALYPEITVLAPAGAKKKIEEKIAVDQTVESVSIPGMKVLRLDGLKDLECCYDFDLGVGHHALCFNDALMNMPNVAGFQGWIMKVLGSTGYFGTTRVGRMLLVKDKQVWKTWLSRQATRVDLKFLTVSHGAPLTTDVSRRLREAADLL